MRWTLFIALLFAAAGIVMAQTKVSFDETNALPKGWASGITGKGAAKWEVVADGSATSKPNVLKQSGEATFCWAARTDERIQDGFVEVKFKPLTGKEDQAGGLVWRFKDANNYYVVRGNALENNVVLYKTEKGKRSSLDIVGRSGGYGTKAEVPKNQWQTLRVEFAGKRFKVILNGKPLFEVEDPTFAEAGKVGLWTKADSVTLFDDFVFGPP